jgi:hypothetical protein
MVRIATFAFSTSIASILVGGMRAFVLASLSLALVVAVAAGASVWLQNWERSL